MDRAKIVSQIARVGAHLYELATKHRAAMIAGDMESINELQAEPDLALSLCKALMSSVASKPATGEVGEPVPKEGSAQTR